MCNLVIAYYCIITFISFGVEHISTGQLQDACKNNPALGNNAIWQCAERAKCKLASTLPRQHITICGNGKICCPQRLRPSEFQKANATAWKKCHEYAKYRFNNYTRKAVLIGQLDQNVSTLDCGQYAGMTITIPWNFVFEKQFPHMALLGFEEEVTDNSSWHCSGSLVSEQFILTAAHCTKSANGDEVKWAVLGIVSTRGIDNSSRGKNLFRIVQRLNHPLYKTGSSYYENHDIALLKLENPIQLSIFIRPICLHHQEQTMANSKVIISGWEQTIDADSTEDLLRAPVRIVDNEICSRRFKKEPGFQGISFSNNTICSEPTQGRYDDHCPANYGGGPMQIQVPGMDECILAQIGVMSRVRSQNCSENPININTRVSFYLPWIQKVVWP